MLLLGLEELQADCWAVLVDVGVRIQRAGDLAGALRALIARPALVVLASARWAQELMGTRSYARPELAALHVVVAAALNSPDELRVALAAGADDVMRVPFEPPLAST